MSHCPEEKWNEELRYHKTGWTISVPDRVIYAPIPEDPSECTQCPTIMSLGENEPYRRPDTNAVLCDRCYVEYLESKCARLEAEKQDAYTEGWNAAIEAAAKIAFDYEPDEDGAVGTSILALSKPTAAKQGGAS